MILLLTSGCTSEQPVQKSNIVSNLTSNYINEKNSIEYITLYTNGTYIMYSVNTGKITGVYEIKESRLRIYNNKLYKDYAFTNDTIIVKTLATGNQRSQFITYRKQ